MIQTKFHHEESHVQFLNQFKLYGFKDKREVVYAILNRLREELACQSLRESADLYAEVYGEDNEMMKLTGAAISGWPE
jgi:hypothetical protein